MPLSLHKSLRSVPIALALAIGIPFPNAAANDQVPKVRVESVRRIFHNGEHNAFTDLCRFKGVSVRPSQTGICPDAEKSIAIPTKSVGKTVTKSVPVLSSS